MTELMKHRPIATIEAELVVAREATQRLRAELMEAELADAPVKVGDIVRVTPRSRPQDRRREGPYEARVAHVRIRDHFTPPDIRVHRRNKGGEWSMAERYVYGTWEVIGHEDGDQ